MHVLYEMFEGKSHEAKHSFKKKSFCYFSLLVKYLIIPGMISIPLFPACGTSMPDLEVAYD